MLEGFGDYPVSICIDLDSYPGPLFHVSRFRNRNGWLTVGELHLEFENEVQSYSLFAACDEYGEGLPAFQASHLLECGCSLADLCHEIPPDSLNDVLSEQIDAAKRRWVRESDISLSSLHEDAAEELEILEGLTKSHIDYCDERIAALRRQRRYGALNEAALAALSDEIAELEEDQDRAVSNLALRRGALRNNVAEQEDRLLKRRQYRVTLETYYTVKWVTPSEVSDDIMEVLRAIPGAFMKDVIGAQQTSWLGNAEQRRSVDYRELSIGGSDHADWLRPPRKPRPEESEIRSSFDTTWRSLPEAERYLQFVSGIWTVERLKTLDLMWAAGRKASEIAEALGLPERRNSIIGKAHRMGMTTRVPADHPPPVITTITPAPSDNFLSKPQHNPPGPYPLESTEVVIQAAWQAERIARLKEMWMQGHSASDIAAQLGNTSRQAVLNRAKSLGLPMRSPPTDQRMRPDAHKAILRPIIKQPNESLATPAPGWSEERIQILVRMWSSGFSAAEIANELGNVSRNAVIGKAKRLGLPMRQPDEMRDMQQRLD